MKYNYNYLLLSLVGIIFLVGCTVSTPEQYSEADSLPTIYPAYDGITIPYNIAPLNVAYDMEGDAFITELKAGGQSLVMKGKHTDWGIKRWQNFMALAKGETVEVYVYAKTNRGWVRYSPIYWHVAKEPIDPYISYRIIAPSYVTYEELSIRQRELGTFAEQMIYNNMLLSNKSDGQCINCHSYKNYKTDNMQFHARQYKGGTLLVTSEGVKKINLKTDSTISAGVYPAWHPTHNLIAYSINDTGQSFHTKKNNKIEVQDLKSDLILYDIDENEVRFIEHDTLEWEVFPTWTPDGKTLYYCSAHMELQDYAQREREIIDRYQEFQYNIYRKAFDPDTKAFGPSELVLDAKAMNKSATFPRVSPDGRYLLFAMGEYGCFHIWHKDADLYLMDLQSMQLRNIREVNSDDVESYHAWSSNGRWMLFTSRRDDGGYTRLYIAYFDKEGKAHKPFLLPQRDPHFYGDYYKSYNVPEFMVEPVAVSPQEFARYLDTEAQPVNFRSQP